MSTTTQPAGASSRVQSAQTAVHARLVERVRKHAEAPWRAPLHGPSQRLFDQLLALLERETPEQLLLDAGCGTGESSHRLAQANSGALVVGVDKSCHRLSRQGDPSALIRRGDCVFIRAELASFWRLLLSSSWRPQVHYLLYPNPWPKASQLHRRWHAHPVFPALLALGGRLEVRCNWWVYAEEFALAIATLKGKEPQLQQLRPTSPLTPFEAKYLASEHPLFQVVYEAD